MSPPGGPRCPPALLALLLALVRSRELQECRERAVTVGGSLCLEPEELPQDWREIRWRVKTDLGLWWWILAATRDGDVSYAKGPFHGRAEFHPGILSLCISPVHKADYGIYTAAFKNSSGIFPIFPQCFQVSVWGIPGNVGLWAALGVSVGLILTLILGFCCWRRRRKEKSREWSPDPVSPEFGSPKPGSPDPSSPGPGSPDPNSPGFGLSKAWLTWSQLT